MAKEPYDSQPAPKRRAKQTNAAILVVALVLIFAIYGFNILRVRNQEHAPADPPRIETPRVAVNDSPAPEPIDDPSSAPDAIDTPTTDPADSENLADAPDGDATGTDALTDAPTADPDAPDALADAPTPDPVDTDALADAPTGDPLDPGTPDALVDAPTQDPADTDALADAPTTDPLDPVTPDTLADAPTTDPSDPDAIAETPGEGPEPPIQVAIVVDEPAVPDPAPAFDEEAFISGGWKYEATKALEAFLAAKTPEEKTAHVLHPERVRSRIERIETPTLTLKPDDFTHVELTEDDHRQGIFLMMRHADADAASPDSHRCYAFFRRTDEGLKLDWEVFSQTRDLSFLRFIETPQPGVSRVFRVFITEDAPPPDSPPRAYRSYFIADLANFNNVIHLHVTNTSPAGRILSSVDFNAGDGAKRIMKNATVELRWTDQSKDSSIELSRFICWKFLGLGGEEIVD